MFNYLYPLTRTHLLVLVVAVIVLSVVIWAQRQRPQYPTPREIKTDAGKRVYRQKIEEGAEPRYAIECGRARDAVYNLSADAPECIRKSVIRHYARLIDARPSRRKLFTPTQGAA